MSNNYTAIIQTAQAMERAIEAKGYSRADVEFTLNYTDTIDVYVRVNYSIDNERKYETYAHSVNSTKTIDEFVTEIWDTIAALPHIEEARNNDFLAQLGATIDRATELDLPLDYVTPLKAAFDTMTENLLADHRTAAEKEPTVKINLNEHDVPF